MSNSAKASHEYLRGTVLTAQPEQLQLMLYDGAIRFALRGRDGLAAKDYEAAYNGFERAQRIVLQLFDGLRRDVNPELVDQMAALYNYVYRRLVDANVQHDLRAVDDALKILRHQRETWGLLIEKLSRERGSPAASAKPTGEGMPAISVEG